MWVITDRYATAFGGHGIIPTCMGGMVLADGISGKSDAGWKLFHDNFQPPYTINRLFHDNFQPPYTINRLFHDNFQPPYTINRLFHDNFQPLYTINALS